MVTNFSSRKNKVLEIGTSFKFAKKTIENQFFFLILSPLTVMLKKGNEKNILRIIVGAR